MSCEKADLVVAPSTLLVQVGDDGMNEMPLEEYVKGSLPGYLDSEAPLEALKAVAVAIRSGAATSRQHAREGFDICTGGHCGAWRPVGRGANSDRAVDETARQVLVVAGAGGSPNARPAASPRLVSAPFFERCDGRTRSSAEAWHSPLSHCLGVACPCGGSELLGHGVGLCLAGAMAMAREGASAEEILKHYFTGADVALASVVARAELCQSLILGRVVDSAGRPLPGVTLVLTGPTASFQRAASNDGRFWFSGLRAGDWQLVVKGASIRRSGLHTDGRSTLETQMTIAGLPPLEVEILPVAYPKKLIGTLGYGGVPVTVTDSKGSQITVESGSVPELDPGGFSIPLPPAGPCSVAVLGQRFTIEVGDTGLWVRFTAQAATGPS